MKIVFPLVAESEVAESEVAESEVAESEVPPCYEA